MKCASPALLIELCCGIVLCMEVFPGCSSITCILTALCLQEDLLGSQIHLIQVISNVLWQVSEDSLVLLQSTTKLTISTQEGKHLMDKLHRMRQIADQQNCHDNFPVNELDCRRTNLGSLQANNLQQLAHRSLCSIGLPKPFETFQICYVFMFVDLPQLAMQSQGCAVLKVRLNDRDH